MMLRWTGRQVLLAAAVLACVATGPGVPAQAESVVAAHALCVAPALGCADLRKFLPKQSDPGIQSDTAKVPGGSAPETSHGHSGHPTAPGHTGNAILHALALRAESRQTTICSSLRARSVVCIVRRTGG